MKSNLSPNFSRVVVSNAEFALVVCVLVWSFDNIVGVWRMGQGGEITTGPAAGRKKSYRGVPLD